MKKQTVSLGIALVFAAVIGAGCGSLIGTGAAADSLPVQLQVATTNDVQLVAWEKALQSLNSIANPTPAKESVDTLLGALIGLTTAAAGWYARHHTARQEIKATLAANCPVLKEEKKT